MAAIAKVAAFDAPIRSQTRSCSLQSFAKLGFEADSALTIWFM